MEPDIFNGRTSKSCSNIFIGFWSFYTIVFNAVAIIIYQLTLSILENIKPDTKCD